MNISIVDSGANQIFSSKKSIVPTWAVARLPFTKRRRRRDFRAPLVTLSDWPTARILREAWLQGLRSPPVSSRSLADCQL